MGLFDKKASKEEINSFKWKLRCGDDPMAHWQAQEEHWEKFRYHKQAAFDLLRELYDVEEISKMSHYATLTVWIWSSDKCKESPIYRHLYINQYGDLNPHKDDPNYCLCCGKELKI